MNSPYRTIVRSLVAAVALSTTGCYAHVYATPVEAPYVYGDAPVAIETYPRVYYDGAWVYNVHGHWYRPTAHGWAYYRRPPVELERRRAYVHAAPAARHYEAPHVYAAPAERVR